ncbi:MAG: hypothetical protein O2960_07240 [Verrucomicrobia bacterium]|nr:hypothetical protein [Verrucomicrobiota bacterium]
MRIKTHLKRLRLRHCPALIVWSLLAACGNSPTSISPQEEQELQQLRSENKEVQRLRLENKDLSRLRRDNDEVLRLQNSDEEIAKLRAENETFKNQLAAYPLPQQQLPPPTPEAERGIVPIQNLAAAFEEAALVVAGQGNEREEDLPKEGDNILIDQSAIEFLIPEFKDNTNGGPYEVSGWLTSKGVVLKNYQQFNYLGITNYHVRRAVKLP